MAKKVTHLDRITKYLRKVGPRTRPEIAKDLRIPIRSVNRVVLAAIDDLDGELSVLSGSLGRGSHTNPAMIYAV